MTTKKKVAFVFATIFTVLALVALGFSISLSIPLYSEPPVTDGLGEGLSVGLSRGFAAVFSLLFGIACVVLALVGFLLSFLNRKVESKPFHKIFVGYSVANAIAFFGAIATYVLMTLFAK